MKLHYRTQCSHNQHPVKLAKSSPRFDRQIENYIRELFEEREISEAQKEKLWKHYHSKLSKALDKGYSPKLKHYDAELAQALKLNLAEFSAFKEADFRKTLQGMLNGGKFPTWSKFREKAVSVSGDYNLRWLETEYRHTVASANMAKKWKAFERNKDLYPNLKYDAVNDGRTREQHRGWDGIVLPMDHPWWDSHYPPNDWGCRCDAVQVDDPVTKKIPPGEVKKGFSNNPAKSGEVFASTPYADGLTGKELKAARDFARKQFAGLSRYSSNYISYRKYLKNPDYKDVEFHAKSGGMKASHIEHKFDKVRGHYEKEVQDLLFGKGDKFVLEIETDTGKNIEGFLNGVATEIKTILGRSSATISKRIAQSVDKGAEICILYFPEFYDAQIFAEALKDYSGKLPKLIVIHQGKIIRDDR